MRSFNTKALCLATFCWVGVASAATLEQHQLAISSSSGQAQIEALSEAIAEYQTRAPDLIQQAINSGASLRNPTPDELLQMFEAADSQAINQVLSQMVPVAPFTSALTPPPPAINPAVVAGVAAAAGAAAIAAGQSGGDDSSSATTTTTALQLCSAASDAAKLNAGTDCESGTASPGAFAPDAEYEAMNTGIAGQGDNDRITSNASAINPLTRHGADHAYERGITGKDTLIAVLDDGYSTSHQEFSGRSITLSAAVYPDSQDHGTHVAALAAGARDGKGMHGFAYDANLFLGDADPDFPGPLSFA